MTASPDGASVARLSELALTTRNVDELDDLAAVVADASLALLDADTVRVLRVDSAHGRLFVLHRAGLVHPGTPEPLPDSYLLVDYPIVLVERDDEARTHVSNLRDPAISERDLSDLRNLGVCAALRIPVVVPGAQWGAIYVTRQDDRPFTAEDVAAAEVIGTLTAAAVDRIERHDALERLAHTDPMTGLANRRAVDEAMELWAADPELSQTMAVVLCDVNGLKQVNDSFGHASGDQLIRETANVISTVSGLLPDAVVARIGGDEFVIASPVGDRERVARMQQELIASASLLTLGDGVSCGSAFGADITQSNLPPASLVRALLRIADAEQYRHKLVCRARRGSTTPDERLIAPTLGGPAASALHSSLPEREAALATITAVTQHLAAGDDPVEVRLSLVAAAVCEAAYGAAWWVSRADLRSGMVRSLHCGTPRPDGERDGAWTEVSVDTTDYVLHDFPATARAVTGTSFAADTDHGDDAERHDLLQKGFSSIIGAGGPGRVEGEAWLIEVYGDALTPDLATSEALLHVMTMLALQAPSPLGPHVPTPRAAADA